MKDVDLERREIAVRRPKSTRDRLTLLPGTAVEAIRQTLARNRTRWESDARKGGGWVELPDAFARKAPPDGREWPWQWLFPATRTYREEKTGQRRRHHLHETVVQRAIERAVRESDIPERATSHTRRHSFATHLLRVFFRRPVPASG